MDFPGTLAFAIGAPVRAFLLLILSVSSVLHAARPRADEWIRGVRFALPVECVWDEALGARPDAQLQELQDLLKRAMAVAARHAPASSVFQWTGATIPNDRRILILLTDRQRPFLHGQLLPVQTEGMIGITAPTLDDQGTVGITVILKLGETVALGPDGKLRSDALGRTIAALGHSLFGAVPSYLTVTGPQLLRTQTGTRDYYQREAEVSQRSVGFFDRIVADRQVPYLDRVSSYWGLAEHRRRFVAGQNQRPEPMESAAVPIAFGYVDWNGIGNPPDRLASVFAPLFASAMRIVSDYPPDGAWNNFFTWDPNTANRIADKQVMIMLANTPIEATRQIATEDIFWALLNSPEFVFNH